VLSHHPRLRTWPFTAVPALPEGPDDPTTWDPYDAVNMPTGTSPQGVLLTVGDRLGERAADFGRSGGDIAVSVAVVRAAPLKRGRRGRTGSPLCTHRIGHRRCDHRQSRPWAKLVHPSGRNLTDIRSDQLGRRLGSIACTTHHMSFPPVPLAPALVATDAADAKNRGDICGGEKPALAAGVPAPVDVRQLLGLHPTPVSPPRETIRTQRAGHLGRAVHVVQPHETILC
jgi:hypothetical protein